MTSVPSTVPSKPLSFMASRRQIIRKEAAINRMRKSQGAQSPEASIHVMKDFKTRSLSKSCQRSFWRDSIQFDLLMARGMAADQLYPAARAIELFSEQPKQGLVGGCIHGRRSDLDAQFVAERLADFIGGRARLQFNREQNAVRLDAKEGR